MQKSMELLQRRNKKQNEIIAEQTRAISKLYTALSGLAAAWQRPHQVGWHAGYDRRIEAARELIKELKI